MHCIFVVGVFNTVTYLLLSAVKQESGKSLQFFYNTLYDFMDLWKLPSDKSGDLKQCFNPSEWSRTHEPKGLSAQPQMAWVCTAFWLFGYCRS